MKPPDDFLPRTSPVVFSRWSRLLAEAALDLDPKDQDRFLADVLREDSALRQEVEALLAADRGASSFLEDPVLGPPPNIDTEPDQLLRRGAFGPYRLIRLLGAGGMGVVFLAKPADEKLAVALKIARSGRTHGHRLEAEGRILERLRHPTIAGVIDVGTVEGLPYVAMEYVEGSPIDQPLAQAPWRRVAEILLEVCLGVEYAHRNLVLHRDLKPANILLTTDDRPKIVDFGVAKLLEESGRPAVASTATQLAGSPATPGYASPEQLRGEPVAVASDVYSLGVVLYKLLCGTLPREIRSTEPKDLERVFATTPTPPSIILASSADPRASERCGSGGFAADLDAIALKALRPEPEARYGSAMELASDLRRCLEARPVAARRWTPVYQVSRFLRRHRKVAAVAAATMLFVSILAVRESMQAVQIAEERDRALVERDRSDQVTEFVTALLKRTDPMQRRPAATTVDEVLASGTEELARRKDLSPEVREALLETLGESNLRRSRLGDAVHQLDSLLQLRRARLPNSAPEVCQARTLLAEAAFGLANDPLAERLTLENLETYRQSEQPDPEAIAQALSLLTKIYASRLDLSRAEASAREALAAWRKVPRHSPAEVLDLDQSLALVLRYQGRFTEAVAIQRRGLEQLRSAPGVPPLVVAIHLEALALALISSAGDLAEAEELLEEALQLRLDTFGDHTAATAMTLCRLGELDLARGELQRARERLEEALVLTQEAGDFVAVTAIQLHLGTALRRLGLLDAAEASYEQAYSSMDLNLPPSHPYRMLPTEGLVEVALARGDLEAAADFLERGRTPCAGAEPYLDCAHLEALEGRWLLARGETAQGSLRLRSGADKLIAVLGPNHPRVIEATAGLLPNPTLPPPPSL